MTLSSPGGEGLELHVHSLTVRVRTRVSDPHHFIADPDSDPAFHFNADPDPDFNAGPDYAPHQGDPNLQPPALGLQTLILSHYASILSFYG